MERYALAEFLDHMLGWEPFTEALVREAPFAEKMALDRAFLVN